MSDNRNRFLGFAVGGAIALILTIGLVAQARSAVKPVTTSVKLNASSVTVTFTNNADRNFTLADNSLVYTTKSGRSLKLKPKVFNPARFRLMPGSPDWEMELPARATRRMSFTLANAPRPYCLKVTAHAYVYDEGSLFVVVAGSGCTK